MKPSRFLLLALPCVFTGFVFLILSLARQAATPAHAQPNPLPTVFIAGIADQSEYQPLFADFTIRTGYPVQYTRLSELNELRYCQAADCPNVIFSTWPSFTREMCVANRLKDLFTVVDTTELNANYTPQWIAYETVGSRLCGIAVNAHNKSLVWYDPQEFSSRGWVTPTTWTGMLALSSQMVTTGIPPWSVGSESGPASGWPLTDWFEDIFLHKYGGDLYDDLALHALSWTSPEVIAAANEFAQIFGNPSYLLGGKSGTLSTSFIDATYPPFETPAQAYLHHQASFAEGFIHTQFPGQAPGVDYAVFPFPNMELAVQNAILGVVDSASIWTDSPGAQALLNYLITKDAADILVANGGLSPNRKVNFGLYGNSNRRQAAQWLVNAGTFRYDLSDLMPAELNDFFWGAIQDLMNATPNQAAMLAVLQQIEARALQFQQVVPPTLAVTFSYTNPSGYQTNIIVPSGAVTQTVVLQHNPLDSLGAAQPGHIYAGRAFSLLAFLDHTPLEQLALQQPIQVTLTYPDPIPQGILEDTLMLYHWDGSQWGSDGIQVLLRDPGKNRLVFSLPHLSDFALFGIDKHSLYLPAVYR